MRARLDSGRRRRAPVSGRDIEIPCLSRRGGSIAGCGRCDAGGGWLLRAWVVSLAVLWRSARLCASSLDGGLDGDARGSSARRSAVTSQSSVYDPQCLAPLLLTLHLRPQRRLSAHHPAGEPSRLWVVSRNRHHRKWSLLHIAPLE